MPARKATTRRKRPVKRLLDDVAPKQSKQQQQQQQHEQQLTIPKLVVSDSVCESLQTHTPSSGSLTASLSPMVDKGKMENKLKAERSQQKQQLSLEVGRSFFLHIYGYFCCVRYHRRNWPPRVAHSSIRQCTDDILI